MKNISVDNGHTFVTPEKAIEIIGLDTILNMVDIEIVNNIYAETEIDFLVKVLEIVDQDLIIG